MLVTLFKSVGVEIRESGWVKSCAARAKIWSWDLRRMSQSASSSRIRALVRFWLTMVLRTFMCARHEPLLPRKIDFSQSSPGTTLSGTSVPETPLAHVTWRLVRAAASVMASRRSVRSGRLMTKIFWNWQWINVSTLSESELRIGEKRYVLPKWCSRHPMKLRCQIDCQHVELSRRHAT